MLSELANKLKQYPIEFYKSIHDSRAGKFVGKHKKWIIGGAIVGGVAGGILGLHLVAPYLIDHAYNVVYEETGIPERLRGILNFAWYVSSDKIVYLVNITKNPPIIIYPREWYGKPVRDFIKYFVEKYVDPNHLRNLGTAIGSITGTAIGSIGGGLLGHLKKR